MYPSPIALKDKLGKLDFPSFLHFDNKIKKGFICLYVMGFWLVPCGL